MAPYEAKIGGVIWPKIDISDLKSAVKQQSCGATSVGEAKS
jgi:hypothetical protein